MIMTPQWAGQVTRRMAVAVLEEIQSLDSAAIVLKVFGRVTAKSSTADGNAACTKLYPSNKPRINRHAKTGFTTFPENFIC